MKLLFLHTYGTRGDNNANAEEDLVQFTNKIFKRILPSYDTLLFLFMSVD